MIRAIWPKYRDLHNSLPASSNTNTRDFLSFFLFWFCSLPAIWFPVHKIRHLFTVKAFFVPVAGVAYFIWAIVKAHGIGPIVHQGSTKSGGALGWAVISGIMSSIANFATLIVNDPDFARFAKKPKDALWSQFITIPVGFAVTSFIGIIVSSSSAIIYDEAVWNPLELLSRFLDGANGAARFGVFIIAFAFALAQLGTNIAANSVSAGTDMTALLPRFLNIRRGGYICAGIGLAMCPWSVANRLFFEAPLPSFTVATPTEYPQHTDRSMHFRNLLSTSQNFITYLSAYSVFLSSIAGVIITDYYVVRRGFYRVKELYSAQKSSPYYFTAGIHWRGYVAYICGILINIVGFVGAIGKPVPKGATYLYNLNFFCGFLVAGGTYWTLCHFFPIPATSARWMEVGDEASGVTYEDKEEEASADDWDGVGRKDGESVDKIREV